MNKIFMTNALQQLVKSQIAPQTNKNKERYLQAMQAHIDSQVMALRKIPAGSLRAMMVNRAIDYLIEESRTQRPGMWSEVTCKKGCSACCHIMTKITKDEAELLVAYLREHDIELDMEKLARQAKFTGTENEWMRGQSYEESACPILGPDGVCRAYQARPASCRKYFVKSDPKMCGASNTSGVSVLGDLQVELAACIGASVDLDRTGNLPTLLFEAMEKS